MAGRLPARRHRGPAAGLVDRRTLLQGLGAAALMLALPNRVAGAEPVRAASIECRGQRLLGYAFGSMNRDVTVFDVATLQPLETKPLGATVRWLANNLNFWD